MRHDVVYSSDAMIVSSSSSFVHGRSRHNFSHARHIHLPKTRNASHMGPFISYLTFNASYVLYYKSRK
jgi:hypothetical protein